jgi:hypothetical protein
MERWHALYCDEQERYEWEKGHISIYWLNRYINTYVSRSPKHQLLTVYTGLRPASTLAAYVFEMAANALGACSGNEY